MPRSRGATWLFLLFFFLSFLDEVSAQSDVVDLSLPWEEGPLYNQNKAYCAIQSSMAPGLIQGWIVIKDGKMVAEGYGKDHDELDRFPAWSVTKSFSTMLVGKMVELRQVTINETLGDIFNNETDWVGVTQATEKKSVTLEELLTMTGGLLTGPDPEEFMEQETLQEVLNFMEYQPEERGNFNYLGSNHILSRIILRRSELTPLQFVQENQIFDKLGISERDFRWTKFGDVEGTAFGLVTTPRSFAKLGQLYLQNGVSAQVAGEEGYQLIQSDWIEASVTNQLPDGTASIQCLLPGYGYQWYVDRTERDGFFVPLKALEGAFAANGYNGQILVVIPSMNMVVAVMSYDLTQVYSQAFLVTILENLSRLDEEVEDALACDDFSLLSFGIQSTLGFALSFCKLLSNLIFE